MDSVFGSSSIFQQATDIKHNYSAEKKVQLPPHIAANSLRQAYD